MMILKKSNHISWFYRYYFAVDISSFYNDISELLLFFFYILLHLSCKFTCLISTTNLQLSLTYLLLYFMFIRFIGIFGNADPLDINQWLQLVTSVPSPTRKFNPRTGICSNMFTGCHACLIMTIITFPLIICREIVSFSKRSQPDIFAYISIYIICRAQY